MVHYVAEKLGMGHVITYQKIDITIARGRITVREAYESSRLGPGG